MNLVLHPSHVVTIDERSVEKRDGDVMTVTSFVTIRISGQASPPASPESRSPAPDTRRPDR